jgi:hypothetical protein
MHDHEDMILTAGGGVSEMTIMWIIMGAMAIHHLWMWYKMKNQKCRCKK